MHMKDEYMPSGSDFDGECDCDCTTEPNSPDACCWKSDMSPCECACVCNSEYPELDPNRN
jgi:hypothetical protein